MTFDEFKTKFDKPRFISLLEGKRDVHEKDQRKLIALGEKLAKQTHHILFRSGNAHGADYFFALGVSNIDPSRLQVIIPYTNHRQKFNTASDTISLNDINLLNEPEVVYQTKGPNTYLVEQYINGKKNRYSAKAAYLLRDTIKVIGTSEIPPTNFAIFYDDLDDPGKGGTGHTISVCDRNKIPWIDQRGWFQWLD